MPLIASDRYTGNQGDSFVSKIFSRGTEAVDGNSYSHGLELWIARWNYEDELSWAYSIYELGGKYNSLSGKGILIRSYNITNFDTTLEFYGDGRLLKSYHMTPDSFSFDISLNVGGVNELKVYAYDNRAVSGGTSFGLADMILSDDLSDKPEENAQSDAEKAHR